MISTIAALSVVVAEWLLPQVQKMATELSQVTEIILQSASADWRLLVASRTLVPGLVDNMHSKNYWWGRLMVDLLPPITMLLRNMQGLLSCSRLSGMVQPTAQTFNALISGFESMKVSLPIHTLLFKLCHMMLGVV